MLSDEQIGDRLRRAFELEPPPAIPIEQIRALAGVERRDDQMGSEPADRSAATKPRRRKLQSRLRARVLPAWARASPLPSDEQGMLATKITSADLTEADLAAARRRDPEAVARVYTAYAPALFRFFVAQLGNRHTAEDLTGEVFAAAIEALPGFRGPVEALGGWLSRIARHDLFDFRRRQARARFDPLDDVLEEAARAAGAIDPEEVALDRVEGARVLKALERLSPRQKEVLLQRAAGLTVSEVAGVLGITTAAVRALQHRGMANLAEALGLRSTGAGFHLSAKAESAK